MSSIITEENVNVRYSDIDFDKSLKPFSLLNFFQDIASDNAENLGFGYSAIYPQGLMWVLLKYRIEFNKYPVNIQELSLKTEPRGYNRLFAYRNFVLSEGQEILARASSMWSLVEFKTMKLVNIADVVDSPYFKKFEPNETDLNFAKIPTLTQIDFGKEFDVRYNDIDVNMHANNGNYIIWALEPLDYKFKSSNKLKTIDMSFKKEIKYGEKLISQVQILENNTTLHVLKNAKTEDDLCTLKCEWHKN
ncbi:hypothetical protein IJ579_03585 [bacterium]|nr:hypothetical protein [bacterium]